MGLRQLWNSALNCPVFIAAGCWSSWLHSCRFYFSSPYCKRSLHSSKLSDFHTALDDFPALLSKGLLFLQDEQSHPSLSQEQNLLAQFLHFDLLYSDNSAGCQELPSALGDTCLSTEQSGGLRKWLLAQGYTSSCLVQIGDKHHHRWNLALRKEWNPVKSHTR